MKKVESMIIETRKLTQETRQMTEEIKEENKECERRIERSDKLLAQQPSPSYGISRME
jgi:hypothetical protein